MTVYKINSDEFKCKMFELITDDDDIIMHSGSDKNIYITDKTSSAVLYIKSNTIETYHDLPANVLHLIDLYCVEIAPLREVRLTRPQIELIKRALDNIEIDTIDRANMLDIKVELMVANRKRPLNLQCILDELSTMFSEGEAHMLKRGIKELSFNRYHFHESRICQSLNDKLTKIIRYYSEMKR